jgi:Leucine-rich repeat (LRR) protein
MKRRRSNTRAGGGSGCCASRVVQFLLRGIRYSMKVESNLAATRGRGCGLCNKRMMLAVFALYLVNSSSAFVRLASSSTARRCNIVGESHRNVTGLDRSGSPVVAGLGRFQTGADVWRSSQASLEQRRRSAEEPIVVDEVSLDDDASRVRIHRSIKSGLRRRSSSRGVENSPVAAAAAVTPPPDNGFATPLPTTAFADLVLTKVSLDFDRSVGDRLLSLDPGDIGSFKSTRLSTSSPSAAHPLSEFTAADLSSIGDLSLGACRIQKVPPRLLTGLIRLERLALWANEIVEIPRGMFDDAVRLHELLLWKNRLKRLDPENFLPSANGGRTGTEETDAAAATMGAVSPLRLLDLDRNQISSIGPSSLPRQRGVSGGPVGGGDTDDLWRRFPELRTLRLSGNRISSIVAGSFRGLSGLRSLTLDSNGLAFIHSDAFAGLQSLVRLSMGDNSIVFVPDGLFAGLGRLVELRLANNKIEHVWSRTFTGLRSLRRLDLTGNRLSQIPDDTFGPSTTPRLALLLLDDNRLRTLRRCVFPPPGGGQSSVTVVERSQQVGRGENEDDATLVFPIPSPSPTPRRLLSLTGNPTLICDCRLTWLANVIESGALRTVWGLCDLQLPSSESTASESTGSSSSSSSSSSASSSWLLAMTAHHHALTSAPAFRSPIQAVVLRGLFDACPPTTECRT